MNTNPPPLLDPHAGSGLPPRKQTSTSHVGLWLSLAAPVVFLLFMALRPG